MCDGNVCVLCDADLQNEKRENLTLVEPSLGLSGSLGQVSLPVTPSTSGLSDLRYPARAPRPKKKKGRKGG
jgi:hypothetical protein